MVSLDLASQHTASLLLWSLLYFDETQYVSLVERDLCQARHPDTQP